MITLEHTEIVGWLPAIRGMRNPMNSWDKSDSTEETIGSNDLGLMNRLVKAGTDHRKFMRMIVVYVDITAPLYWWKEFDTYKVGTVRNSCSTMHKITAKKFELNDFSYDKLSEASINALWPILDILNNKRDDYLNPVSNNPENEGLRKHYWYQLIQLLPSSYNQRATIMLNYEVLTNMYHARKDHKLDEWHVFCDWIKTLPHSELITRGE